MDLLMKILGGSILIAIGILSYFIYQESLNEVIQQEDTNNTDGDETN